MTSGRPAACLYRLISGQLPRVLPDVGHYAAAATRGDPVPRPARHLRRTRLARRPGDGHARRRPRRAPHRGQSASEVLSSAQFSAPVRGLPVATAPPGPARPGHARGGPAGGAASEDPLTTPVAQAAAAHGRQPLATAEPRQAPPSAAWRLWCSPGRSSRGGSAPPRRSTASRRAAPAPPAASHAAAAARVVPGPRPVRLLRHVAARSCLLRRAGCRVPRRPRVPRPRRPRVPAPPPRRAPPRPRLPVVRTRGAPLPQRQPPRPARRTVRQPRARRRWCLSPT